jgi:hypothetical protein
MSRFNQIEFEFNTITPSLNLLAQSLNIYDQDGLLVAINKPYWNIYQYNFNLFVFEERFNQVVFSGGNCGLLYAY